MYALLIIFAACFACALLLMAGARPFQTITLCGVGGAVAMGGLVAFTDMSPDARWAATQARNYESSYRLNNGDRICAGFEDWNIYERYVGENRWCAQHIAEREGAIRYEAAKPCMNDVGNRIDELASIEGATVVQHGKRVIAWEYLKKVCL